MKTLFSLLVSCLLVTAQTNEIFPVLTVGDKIYTNCTFSVLNPVEGMVKFENGGAKIMLKELPEPLRGKYFDEVKAVEFAASESKRKEALARASKAAIKERIESFREKYCRLIGGEAVEERKLEYVGGRVIGYENGGIVIEWDRGRQVLVKNYTKFYNSKVVSEDRIDFKAKNMGTETNGYVIRFIYDCGTPYHRGDLP